LDQHVDRHHKIRFRRGDITSFATYPSAADQQDLLATAARRKRFGRWALFAGAGLASILILAAGAIYFLAVYGISTDSVRTQAEAAIGEIAGMDVRAGLGPARISFGGSGLVTVRIDDIDVRSASDDQPLLEAAGLEFGLKMVPLLSGDLEFASARLIGAEIFVGSTSGGGDGLDAGLLNEAGLVDPDRVLEAVFAGIHRAFAALTSGAVPTVELRDIGIGFADDAPVRNARIHAGDLMAVDPGTIRLSMDGQVDGRAVTLAGEAQRDTVFSRIAGLRLDVNVSAPDEPLPAAVVLDHLQPDYFGTLAVTVDGEEGIDGAWSTLAVSASLGPSRVWLDRVDYVEGTLGVEASIEAGAGLVDITRAKLATGNSTFEFRGKIGPRASEGERPATYRIEMISDRSVAAPVDSPEQAVEFVARAAGFFDPSTTELVFDDIGLRTSGGEMAASAAFDFEPDRKPGIMLSARIAQMPVAHVKQLWPYIAAPGARRWALGRLFGGTVRNSTLQYNVVPGRLGNGVPLGHDEVFGRFELEGARFDVTGEIPPVRDAVGIVAFQGNDVAVSLSSGTAFMDSGRIVHASAGTLTIKDAYKDEVNGALDLHVEGTADAIAELASAEPIDGMRQIGMSADDFSGEASGTIKALVPIFGDQDPNELGWQVALDFKNLALSKPIDGQALSEAEGNIVVDPEKAVIKAKAKLNGAPAVIEMVEPFDDDGPARRRDIELVLDDAARELFVPGIGDLVSGPVRVKVDTAKEPQSLAVDLTDARLNIPWAGWTKGPGIVAAMDFVLENDGNTTRLSKLRLVGQSFEIAGDVTLEEGSLRSARFDTVRLNRDDNVTLTIDRTDKAMDVEIRGKSLDIRSIVTQLGEDAEGTAESAGSQPVRLTATVETLTGFHGERLRGVDLTYAGQGSRIDALRVTATTANGAPVRLSDNTSDGIRTTEMESTDAGSVLRFLDIYKHMEGGRIKFGLAGAAGGTMKGQIDAVDFWIVDEPKLASIVSSTPPGDERSLNQAVKSEIDTKRVRFQRGYALVEKGPGSLALQRGVLRGPLIGSTFQGTVYDADGNIDMTGTFMPAYGINRIFGEIPLVGIILGNGRDRGLIGITYRLIGKAAEPDLQINPLSLIAPGIFRQIFEFR
jgi:hypothetical protein